jgi:hypothetical protein
MAQQYMVGEFFPFQRTQWDMMQILPHSAGWSQVNMAQRFMTGSFITGFYPNKKG